MSVPKEGVPVIVHRARRPRVTQSVVYVVLGMIVAAVGAVTLLSGLTLAFVEIAVGVGLWVFGARAWRSGYLSVSPTTIVVRTTARTRAIPVSSVADVTAAERRQLTPRVIPTLWFTDGSAYPLADFSLGAGSYHRARDRGHPNVVDATVVLVRSVL
ncbi:MAG TPA: hypothetical protein VGS61_04525 [Acidimicrobiales bacterium]|nr:hypothetical protein [Acidimicrobiales bacterium]